MYEKIIAITNRKLCEGNFLDQVNRICRHKPKALILREKDLSESEYESLASNVMNICGEHSVKFIAHTFINAARNIGCKNIHLSMPALRHGDCSGFHIVGASCHSIEDVLEAQRLGAKYVFLGNIYETDCKKGLPGRGLDLLCEACSVSSIPVYAIGGVNFERMNEILYAGAEGGCMMSGAMKWN